MRVCGSLLVVELLEDCYSHWMLFIYLLASAG